MDLNRAGTPLVEIVAIPICARAQRRLRTCARCATSWCSSASTTANLEEGSFRCDANVSIRAKGTEKFGTRCELKNINSFKFVQRAIDAEIVRQTAILDSGGKIRQETRSFDPDTGLTATLRSKEEAHDYRYFRNRICRRCESKPRSSLPRASGCMNCRKRCASAGLPSSG